MIARVISTKKIISNMTASACVFINADVQEPQTRQQKRPENTS